MAGKEQVLVTGAAGFLAAWIIPRLLQCGINVVATDLRRETTRLRAIDRLADTTSLDWIDLDIASTDATTRVVREVAPSAIIHLAALQIPACRAAPALGARVNVIGHVNMLEAARSAGCRLIYTSSVAAKPRPPHNAPANLYGVYKHTCEEVSRLYAQDFGVASLGLRPHVVYGVGRDAGETSAITEAMRAAALGVNYTIPWRTRTCFQYAGDIAEMFARAVACSWSGALVSDMSTEVESTDDVIAAIREAAPESQVEVEGADRISPVTGFDVAPLETIIGIRPRTSLQDGVSRTIQMFRRLNDASTAPS